MKAGHLLPRAGDTGSATRTSAATETWDPASSSLVLWLAAVAVVELRLELPKPPA